MKTTNAIGLDTKKAAEIAEMLNNLLANYQILYMNLRGFHWNIKGASFFELHLKFEELYNDALLKVDEIAERVLTLGDTPLHTFEDYIDDSEIRAEKGVYQGTLAIDSIVDSFGVLLKKERDILAVASEAADEGTVALMSEYIVQQEKLVWMLTAYRH